jgi:hypothetical protein
MNKIKIFDNNAMSMPRELCVDIKIKNKKKKKNKEIKNAHS